MVVSRGETGAILLVVLSSLLFAVGYALAKRLVTDYGLTAPQLTFLRCALVVFGAALVGPVLPGLDLSARRVLRPARAWEQRGAAALLVVSNALSVIGYALLPVTEATAIGFTTPLLLAALAALVLRERVSATHWAAVLIGFVGMLLVVRPGGAGFAGVGALASLGAALAYAVYQVLIRRLRAVAGAADTVVQVGLAGIVMLGGFMVTMWHPLSLRAALLVLTFTALVTGGLAAIAAAIRRGAAARLAPWQYSGLIWAMLLDVGMFGRLPSGVALAGAALIALGGILSSRSPAE